MSQRITIDPITRLEGHGKIEIFLDDSGEVANAYLQIPELRGFERFCIGRAAEEMPRITQRICGVCPSAHHMASARALDDLYHVDPPPAAHKIRELFYNLFMFEDHTLHFYFLGGPDFIVGPTAPAGARNIVGVIGKVGLEIGGKVIEARKIAREFMAEMAGKVIHPVFGLPGGVSKPLKAEMVDRLKAAAPHLVDFAQFSLQAFHDIVLGNQAYVDTILADYYAHKTNYMGMVDANGKNTYYRGNLRVIDPTGKRLAEFPPQDYLAAHRRTRRAVVVHQVPVPQDAGLEGVRRRRGQRPLPRGPARAPQRGRRHGHAAGAGPLRGVLQDAGRQARPQHAGHPLGAAHRGAAGDRGHPGPGERPGDSEPGRPETAGGPADGRHRHRRGAARAR